MATPTYDLLDSTTLSANASYLQFSNLDIIAAGYRDLRIVVDAKATGSSYYAYMRFNNSSSTQYLVYANGNGSNTASSGPGDNKFQLGARDSYWTSNNNNLVTVDVFDFSQTDKHKSALVRFNNPAMATEMMACRLPSTSAITSIRFTMNVSQFASGGTFYLYGIAG